MLSNNLKLLGLRTSIIKSNEWLLWQHCPSPFIIKKNLKKSGQSPYVHYSLGHQSPLIIFQANFYDDQKQFITTESLRK